MEKSQNVGTKSAFTPIIYIYIYIYIYIIYYIIKVGLRSYDYAKW